VRGGKVGGPAPSGGVEETVKGAPDAPQTAEPNGAHVISQDQYDEMWACITESKARVEACRQFTKTLGYSKFAHVKVSDLDKMLAFAKEH
jgi:hypothetical protein